MDWMKLYVFARDGFSYIDTRVKPRHLIPIRNVRFHNDRRNFSTCWLGPNELFQEFSRTQEHRRHPRSRGVIPHRGFHTIPGVRSCCIGDRADRPPRHFYLLGVSCYALMPARTCAENATYLYSFVCTRVYIHHALSRIHNAELIISFEL